MSQQTDESWIHGNSLSVMPEYNPITRHPSGIVLDLYAGLYAELLASIPTPDPNKGWLVKSVMLRYRIWSPISEFGFGGHLEEIRINDADLYLWNTFLGTDTGPTIGYRDLRLELPEPKSFKYGLGVHIRPFYQWVPIIAPLLTYVNIASVGLGFVKH